MIHIKYFVFLLSITAFSFSCKNNELEKSSEAKLLNAVVGSATGTVDSLGNSVVLKVADSTDITKVLIKFEISKNATIYPPSAVALDYSTPITFTITSEDKTKTKVFTVSILKPIVNFTVYDCSSWTPQNFYVPQPNALIKVYKVGTTKIYDVLTTTINAKATLYGLKSNDYYFTVEKDNKSNIVNGYLIAGTYNSQTDIRSSAYDANATIGGLKYKDVNGDARINIDDMTNADYISNYYLIGKPILEEVCYIANK